MTKCPSTPRVAAPRTWIVPLFSVNVWPARQGNESRNRGAGAAARPPRDARGRLSRAPLAEEEAPDCGEPGERPLRRMAPAVDRHEPRVREELQLGTRPRQRRRKVAITCEHQC